MALHCPNDVYVVLEDEPLQSREVKALMTSTDLPTSQLYLTEPLGSVMHWPHMADCCGHPRAAVLHKDDA